jgi:hypothetical protein
MRSHFQFIFVFRNILLPGIDGANSDNPSQACRIRSFETATLGRIERWRILRIGGTEARNYLHLDLKKPRVIPLLVKQEIWKHGRARKFSLSAWEQKGHLRGKMREKN